MNPYLAPEEGLQAVFRYAEIFDVPVSNESAEQINRLCMSDPFFISCVIQSDYEKKELMTEFRTRKHFSLSVYFDGETDKSKLNIIDSRMRHKFQRTDGKEMEIDVLAESDCKRVILTEVKKTVKKTGLPAVREFFEKAGAFAKCRPGNKVLHVFLSVGGFTGGAMKFCLENGIGTTEKIAYL